MPRERAFTLIELLVALVLSAIVLALVFGVVLDLMGSSERSSVRNKAQKSATLAADMLTTDLRAMRAPQREPSFTGSPDSLRSLLLEQRNPSNLLVHDILLASATRVTFYADVVGTSAGVECVTWFVRSDGSLQRDVRRPNAGCSGGTPTRGGGGPRLQHSEVMPAPERARATAAIVIPNPFSYELLVQPDAAAPDPDACATRSLPVPAAPLQALQPLERDQVTGIGLDLRSFVAGRVARGDQSLATSVSIASRQSMEYRYGIGCVA